MCVCGSVCVRESECIFCLLMLYNAAFISYHSLFCAPVLVGQCSNGTVCRMCRGKQVMHLYFGRLGLHINGVWPVFLLKQLKLVAIT